MSNPIYDATAAFAVEMDARDPLAAYRDRFHIPTSPNGTPCVYLCGNSLGLQPKMVRQYLEQELKDWELLGVEGHFRACNPWMPYHKLLTEKTARLVGAKPIEVVTMNSLTVNLHLLMVSFYRPTRQRHKILIEGGAFPSDQYAVKSQLQFHGYDPASSLLEIKPRDGESCLREEDIQSCIEREGDSIALILLSGVNYATGQAFDLPAITQAGHARGCIVGFDLAHVAGNLLLQLHKWDVDFAVWCGYKYMNGGPGCVAGAFVHEKHAGNSALPRFAGWWGHYESTRFLISPEFRVTPGAEGWQLSNAPVLSMACLRASLDIFEEAGMERLWAKSKSLTGYLEFLLERHSCSGFSIITPRDPTHRGAQLSLRLSRNGRKICEQLATQGVICDWREPDILRVAPAPLYNSYRDVYRFVEHFIRLLIR